MIKIETNEREKIRKLDVNKFQPTDLNRNIRFHFEKSILIVIHVSVLRVLTIQIAYHENGFNLNKERDLKLVLKTLILMLSIFTVQGQENAQSL